MSLRAWIQSSRPLAQANIALPLLWGEMLAFAQTQRLDIGLLVVAHGLGVLDQLFIVWTNDVADESADRLNENPTPFSGGSRVLPQGALTARQLTRAAIGAAGLMLALASYTALALDRPATPLAWTLLVLLPWAYSVPPARLSYRGLGALTQAFGVMAVLPLLGYYLQVGRLEPFPWLALIPALLLGLASNITTALPDHRADEAAGKATWPVRYGLARARTHCLQLIALGVVATPLVVPDLPRSGWAAIEALPLLLLALNARGSRRARPLDRAASLRFVVINGAAINLTIAGWIVALALHPAGGG